LTHTVYNQPQYVNCHSLLPRDARQSAVLPRQVVRCPFVCPSVTLRQNNCISD